MSVALPPDQFIDFLHADSSMFLLRILRPAAVSDKQITATLAFYVTLIVIPAHQAGL